jgi:hypothetical protein
MLACIFHDATDVTYADLEEALHHIHELKGAIRRIKAGQGGAVGSSGESSLSLRLQE